MTSGSSAIDKVRAYLSEPRHAVLATLGSGGAPHQAVVHYLLGRDHLLVNGRPHRVWAGNLRRDPRVSVVVHDADHPLHWVGLKGVAQVVAEGQAAVDDAVTIALRYGEDPDEYRVQDRISFAIVPSRVSEFGLAAPAAGPAAPGVQRQSGPSPASVTVRQATPDDWPAIWPFMRKIVAAGETFSWDTDIDEQRARAAWMLEPPGRTLVATTADGIVVGTAEMGPNHGGPGAHVATAGFMVDPDRAGHGAGRALGERVIAQAREDGYRAIQFNAVVETNTRAVSLWRSLGFEVVATVPEAFHHPRDGYVGLHIMYLRL